MGYSLSALVTVFANLMYPYQKLGWVGELKYLLLVVVLLIKQFWTKFFKEFKTKLRVFYCQEPNNLKYACIQFYSLKHYVEFKQL